MVIDVLAERESVGLLMELMGIHMIGGAEKISDTGEYRGTVKAASHVRTSLQSFRERLGHVVNFVILLENYKISPFT